MPHGRLLRVIIIGSGEALNLEPVLNPVSVPAPQIAVSCGNQQIYFKLHTGHTSIPNETTEKQDSCYTDDDYYDESDDSPCNGFNTE